MPKADVDIRLRADTAQASQQLRAVSRDLNAATEASTGSGSPKGSNALAQAESAGAPLGKIIGKAMVGFVAHEGLSTVSSLVGNRQGGRLWGNRIASVGGSAVAGGTAGALVGSMIPGLGTAIGASIGTIAGAVTGFVKTMSEEARNFREAMNAISSSHIAVGNTQTLGTQDRAFERLQSLRQRPEQVSALEDRLATLRFGEGPNSIKNLQSRILKAEKAGETDSVEYLNDKDLFARQKGREATIMRQLEEMQLPVSGSPIQAREVVDRLGAMGGTVGAQVDVADVNQRQLDVLRQIYEAISKPGNQSVDAATPFFDKSFYD